MEDRKPDRRVVRTRQLLRESLIALILEKGYDSVTIQDITDRANLRRATFYLHYHDKEELLLTTLAQTFDELVTRIPASLQAGKPPSLIAFQHVAENRDLYTVMIRVQCAQVIYRRVRDYLADVVQRNIEIHSAPYPADAPSPILAAQYVAGAILGLITWWIENDLPHTPEYMADCCQQMAEAGLWGIFKGR